MGNEIRNEAIRLFSNEEEFRAFKKHCYAFCLMAFKDLSHDEIEDVISDSAISCISGDRASWNKAVYPTFYKLYCSIMKSRKSNISNKYNTRYDKKFSGADYENNIAEKDELKVDKLLVENIRNIAFSLCKNDRLATRILHECFDDNVEFSNTKLLSDLCEVPPGEITKAKRRFVDKFKTKNTTSDNFIGASSFKNPP